MLCDAGGGTVVRTLKPKKLSFYPLTPLFIQDLVSYKVKKVNPLELEIVGFPDGTLADRVLS